VKLAVSNIALSAYQHEDELKSLPQMGLSGLEVAPSRVWKDSWHGLSSKLVDRYRNHVEQAGMSIIGLHSLFYDKPELGLFQDAATRQSTLDFLVHLSKLCRDLGGKTLIYGARRWRGNLSFDDAISQSLDFFSDLIPRIEDHRTVFCFEPLGPTDTDFINSVYESISLVKRIGHPALRVQLDAKALVINGEMKSKVFQAAAPFLVHVHANEPDLGILGTSGQVNNQKMGRLLRHIKYEGYVSIEQKMIKKEAPLDALRKSAKLLKECYG
jgi:sugar phosphate isomerase/epimerase